MSAPTPVTATSPYLNKPLRTLAEVLAARLAAKPADVVLGMMVAVAFAVGFAGWVYQGVGI